MAFTTKAWINGQLVDATGMIDLESRLSTYTDSRNNGEYGPVDHGMIAWTYDPGFAAQSSLLIGQGTVHTIRLKIGAAASITNIWLSVLNAGVTLTSGQCFAGVYQAGTLIGTSADQATSWQSATMKTIALVGGPFAVTAGEIIVALFANGSTLPGFSRVAAYSPQTNLNLTTANSRFGTADTGRTTSLPGTLGTIAAVVQANFWAGVN